MEGTSPAKRQVIQVLLKFEREDRAYRELVMAERRPIFVNKGSRPQIGYIEVNEAFDLSSRRCCIYNAESGNLSSAPDAKRHTSGRTTFQGVDHYWREVVPLPDTAG